MPPISVPRPEHATMDISMSDQSSPTRARPEDADLHGLSKLVSKDAKKFRDEYDLAMSKLADQKFDPGK